MRLRMNLAAMVVVLVAGWATAQPLVDRVPGDAMIYVGWSGSEHMGPLYPQSHLKAVMDASEFPKLIDESIPKLLKKIGATDREAAEFTQLLSAIGGPMWRHPTAFYFGGLDMPANGPPAPKLALICDAGKEGAGLAGQLRNLLAKAPQGGPVQPQVIEQNGLVILFTGPNQWAAGGKPAAALAASRTFGSALAQVSKESVGALYIDLEAIVNLVNQMVGNSPEGQQWAKVRDALGLGGIKRVIWTAGFDGKDWMNQAFIDAPAPRQGALPAMIDAKPLSDDILKTIPQSATVAMAGKFDLGALVKGIRTAAGQIEPQAGQMIDGALAEVKKAIGLDIQTDLLDLFGDEWAIYMDPQTAGSGMLGFALVNKTRDGQKLDASLTKLEDMGNALMKQALEREKMTIEFKRSKVGDLTLHHLAVPFVAPTWAIKDGNLYAGLYPQVVGGAAEHVSSKGKSILENEQFQAVRMRLGNQAITGFTFADLPKTAPDGYQQIMLMSRIYLGFADMFGADTPAMMLPPLKKITPHLSPAGGVSWVDNQGWHSKSISPFPGATMLTPGGGGQVLVAQQALMASILLPSLNRARETANRVKCASNMRQIGMGILLYANDNKGKYPPDLGTILKTQDITGEVFVCVSGNNGLPGNWGTMAMDDRAKWIDANADYIYLGKGMNAATGADTIVLHEKVQNHGQGMNMLFGDGHVEWMMMPQAMQMIEKQQAGKRGGGL